MLREIEAKYRIDDPAALREKLAEDGAERLDQVRELNRLYDTPDGALKNAGSGLRLRTSRSRGDSCIETLTFKGPRQPGTLKIREEIETPAPNGEHLRLILTRLGYREIVVYEKNRETWRFQGCEICLDELPVLGWFCEIEGPDEQAVLAAGERLALNPDDLTQDTYPGLTVRRGRKNAEGCFTLLFEEPA